MAKPSSMRAASFAPEMRFIKRDSDASIGSTATADTEHCAHHRWRQARDQVKQSQALLRANSEQALKPLIDECGHWISVALKQRIGAARCPHSKFKSRKGHSRRGSSHEPRGENWRFFPGFQVKPRRFGTINVRHAAIACSMCIGNPSHSAIGSHGGHTN
jgi:hypothetical protein